MVSFSCEGDFDSSDEGSYGVSYDALVDEMETGMHEFSDEEWAFPVPERLTAALSDLPEESLRNVAADWSQTEEFEMDSLGAEVALDYLVELKTKAGLARQSGKQLYLWMSL